MWMCLEFSDSGNSSSDLSEYESDGDMEDSLSPSSPNKRLTDLADTPLQLKDYMSLMDRELAQTTIGESFVRQPPTQAAATDKVRQGFRRRPQGVRWVELDSLFEVSSYVQINPSCFQCRLLFIVCPLLTFCHIFCDFSTVLCHGILFSSPRHPPLSS